MVFHRTQEHIAHDYSERVTVKQMMDFYPEQAFDVSITESIGYDEIIFTKRYNGLLHVIEGEKYELIMTDSQDQNKYKTQQFFGDVQSESIWYASRTMAKQLSQHDLIVAAKFLGFEVVGE